MMRLGLCSLAVAGCVMACDAAASAAVLTAVNAYRITEYRLDGNAPPSHYEQVSYDDALDRQIQGGQGSNNGQASMGALVNATVAFTPSNPAVGSTFTQVTLSDVQVYTDSTTTNANPDRRARADFQLTVSFTIDQPHEWSFISGYRRTQASGSNTYTQADLMLRNSVTTADVLYNRQSAAFYSDADYSGVLQPGSYFFRYYVIMGVDTPGVESAYARFDMDQGTFTLTPIPEPTGLLLLPVAGLLLRRRR